jgi:hypothetical protein
VSGRLESSRVEATTATLQRIVRTVCEAPQLCAHVSKTRCIIFDPKAQARRVIA